MAARDADRGLHADARPGTAPAAHGQGAGPQVRVLIPSGALGISIDPAALEAGLAMAPHIIAIDGGSTHSYGASFDIAYTDRPNNDADCSAPTLAIQHVLKTFQKSGRILVIPEKNCMHITLRP